MVVIDEAAQSLEAGCWIPLLRAPRCKYLFGYTKTVSTRKGQTPKLGNTRMEARTKKSLLPFIINLHNFVFFLLVLGHEEIMMTARGLGYTDMLVKKP